MPEAMPLPMPKPPGGGLPSPMAAAPANAGPIAQPQGNQGNVQAAMAKISSGMKMIQEALPLIPMGSEIHTEVLKAVTSLSKVMNKEGESPTTPKLDLSSIMQMIKQHQQNAPQNAMAKMMPAQGATQPPATGASPIPPAAA
jgi:hypothetical protein